MDVPITDNTDREQGPTDAQLVAATLGGDRQALGHIYDRYSDRIHTMCVHMLGDQDEAADVCGEVFLVAFQRLDQLRDPSRLRPWLYAICRHEVYRRTKRRGRIRLVEEVSEMDRVRHHEDSDTLDASDAAALALVVQQAAAGLDDRDRLVLQLQLQGLEGDDLAAALGTSTSTSYQHVHRMRERMERSVGALLVARQGRADCNELDGLLSSWDGHFSVLWRKRVARHVDGCEVCERRRKAVPAALFGTAGASPLVVTPTSVRERVLGAAVVGGGGSSVGGGGRRWRGDGFPPSADDSRRWTILAPVAGLVLLLLAGGLWALVGDDPVTVATADRSDSTTTSIATSTSSGDDATTTTAADPTTTSSLATTSVPVVVDTTVPSPSTSRAPRVTTTAVAPTTTAAPRTTTSASPTSTTSTTTTTVAPPTLRLSGPSTLYDRAANGGTCANQVFSATITSAGVPASVTLRWTAGAATGTVAMLRNRSRNGWNGTIDLPFGTTGAVTIVAEATAGGSTGRSNTLSAVANPCPVIG